MRVLLLIHGDEAAEAALSPAERRSVMEAHVAYAARLRDAGVLVTGDPLQPTAVAATIRWTGDDPRPQVTDGPFAETKEQLGGYYVVEVRDRAEAVEWGSQVPASPGVVVEVRPLAEMA
jgi:hypothetical protein